MISVLCEQNIFDNTVKKKIIIYAKINKKCRIKFLLLENFVFREIEVKNVLNLIISNYNY